MINVNKFQSLKNKSNLQCGLKKNMVLFNFRMYMFFYLISFFLSNDDAIEKNSCFTPGFDLYFCVFIQSLVEVLRELCYETLLHLPSLKAGTTI